MVGGERMAPLTALQVTAAAYVGGWTTDRIDAVALAKVQSGYDPGLVRGDNYGLWQIRKGAHGDLFQGRDWRNPADNARMARILFEKDAGIPHTNGNFGAWPSHGGPRWRLALPEAKAADKEFRRRMAAGEDPQQIAGAQRSDGRSPPESGPGGDLLRGAGINSLADLAGLAKALTSPHTWMRVAQVVLGVLLITVGLLALSGLAGRTPAGRVARALR